MYLVLGQGSPGEAIADLLCPLIGFVVILCTIIIFSKLAIRQFGPKDTKRKSGLLAAGLIFSVLSVIWLPLAIDKYYYEPQIDLTIAWGIIEHLPEVQGFIQDGEKRGIPREIKWDEYYHSPDFGTHTVKFNVGDYDKSKDQLTTVWKAFSVNLVDSKVGVHIDQSGGKWVPLKEWRKLENNKQ